MIKRLGLVLECDTGGPDELVFRCLARRLSAPGKEPEVIPLCLGNKRRLMEDSVSRAEVLVSLEQCDLVLIVWDLKPLWEEPPAKKCADEAALLRSRIADLNPAVRPRIRLLCLTWELETWLIAEDRAVRDYLSKPAHPSNFKAPANLDTVTDPKSYLSKQGIHRISRKKPALRGPDRSHSTHPKMARLEPGRQSPLVPSFRQPVDRQQETGIPSMRRSMQRLGVSGGPDGPLENAKASHELLATLQESSVRSAAVAPPCGGPF